MYLKRRISKRRKSNRRISKRRNSKRRNSKRRNKLSQLGGIRSATSGSIYVATVTEDILRPPAAVPVPLVTVNLGMENSLSKLAARNATSVGEIGISNDTVNIKLEWNFSDITREILYNAPLINLRIADKKLFTRENLTPEQDTSLYTNYTEYQLLHTSASGKKRKITFISDLEFDATNKLQLIFDKYKTPGGISFDNYKEMLNDFHEKELEEEQEVELSKHFPMSIDDFTNAFKTLSFLSIF